MLVETAKGLGLDAERAEAAIEQQSFGERIQQDIDGAVRGGVHATPTFFINGEQYEGAWTFEELVAAIDQAL